MNKEILKGRKCSALGTCGVTNGITVSCVLSHHDNYGVYIVTKKCRIHLCNPNTINYE